MSKSKDDEITLATITAAIADGNANEAIEQIQVQELLANNRARASRTLDQQLIDGAKNLNLRELGKTYPGAGQFFIASLAKKIGKAALVKCGMDDHDIQVTADNLLFYGCTQVKPEWVKAAITLGADANKKHNHGNTALHYLAESNGSFAGSVRQQKSPEMQIATMLKAAGADMSACKAMSLGETLSAADVAYDHENIELAAGLAKLGSPLSDERAKAVEQTLAARKSVARR